MSDEDEPVQHCKLTVQTDIVTALESTEIDHLSVDDHRIIVIYQQAILMLIVMDGQTTATRTFDVELWNPPANDPDRDPDEILTAFVTEVVAAADTTRIDE